MKNYIGHQIDRYHIIEQLGVGGMAVVYKAYDMRLEREVALKLIRADAIPAEQHERLMKRFEREAKSQARFSHPNIISVHDYGEIDGAPYLVMEFIPGGTLKARIKGPTDYRQAFGWLIPIADALQYAHERHTIHRDIKPSNILFGENDRPILTDFGIAKILETDEATLTGTGLGVGTPEYMAPEQWQGQASPATDQYALGVVLYELLTGEKPYTADTPVVVALLQMSEPLRSPRSIVPGIPEPVEKLLYKPLARDPQDRYGDMTAFRKALEKQLIEKPAEAAEPVEKIEQPSKLTVTFLSEPGSETETVDILELTPPEALRSPIARQTEKSYKKESKKRIALPTWAQWSIGAALLVTGMVIGISLLSQYRDRMPPTAAEPTEASVAMVDTPMSTNTDNPEPMATETHSPTNTVTSTPTHTPTATATPLSEGFFLMPDFKELGIEETVKFLDANNLNYQLAIFVDNEVGGILSQKPEPGELSSDSTQVVLEVSAVFIKKISSRFSYDVNERENVYRSYSLDVNEGEIFYVNSSIYECFFERVLTIPPYYEKEELSGCSYTYSLDGDFNKNSIYVVSKSKSINIRYSCNFPSWMDRRWPRRECGITLAIFKIY